MSAERQHVHMQTLLCLRSRRQVEIRAANEIDEAVAHAVRDGKEQSTGGGAVGGERISSPVPVVSRPSRPGRGRARLTKRS